jgi:hypothetical protein
MARKNSCNLEAYRMNKGEQPKTKKFAGLDERDFTTNQTGVPSLDFAGVAKLNGQAIMTPLLSRIVATPQAGGKGK